MYVLLFLNRESREPNTYFLDTPPPTHTHTPVMLEPNQDASPLASTLTLNCSLLSFSLLNIHRVKKETESQYAQWSFSQRMPFQPLIIK